jgi:hypothetical protein
MLTSDFGEKKPWGTIYGDERKNKGKEKYKQMDDGMRHGVGR